MNKIRAIVTERQECIASVIETLQTALEEAKAGQIVGICCSIVRPNGSITWKRSATDDLARQIGALRLAEHKLLRDALDSPGESDAA